MLWGCAERAGMLNPSKVCVGHVGFGVLLGEDKMKFKTRSGESLGLVDLLDEGRSTYSVLLVQGFGTGEHCNCVL